MSAKNAILKAKLEGVIYEVLVKTNAANVMVDESTTLAAKLTSIIADIATKANTSDMTTALEAKAEKSHTHAQSEITGLTDLLATLATSESVTSAIDALRQEMLGDTPVEAYNTFTELAAYIAEHKEAADALTAAVGNKADKATTLSGYGITDAYTKTEVDNKIADAVSDATGGESAASVKTALEAYETSNNARIDALEADTHTHSNKTVLDSITADKVTAWDGKADLGADGKVVPSQLPEVDTINIDFKYAWTYDTIPRVLSSYSVTYGDGKFVAVEYNSNKAVYSTDGVTWTSTTLPSSSNWCSITYGDGKFVAVADNSTKSAYSTDGITWTAATTPIYYYLRAVTYGDGKFVAFANSKAVYSTDGSTWTESTLPSSNYWTSVTYGDGKFVAVADDSSKAVYSTDGITWTESIMPISASWNSVTYGDGKFVAVAVDGTNKAAYSMDGITWTESTLPSYNYWESVTYGEGEFVAVASSSNKAAYSTDGSTWTESIMPISDAWNSVTYGDGKFVAVGSNYAACYAGQKTAMLKGDGYGDITTAVAGVDYAAAEHTHSIANVTGLEYQLGLKGSANIYYSDTEPASLNEGDLWVQILSNVELRK